MSLSVSLIEADIITAKQAIACYEKSKPKDMKNIAAYHLQQAAEKLIKIQIRSELNNSNNATIYTHNIEKLLAYSERMNMSINVPAYIKENSLILTAWESSSRYEVGFRIRIDMLKRALSEIESWYKILYSNGLREA